MTVRLMVTSVNVQQDNICVPRLGDGTGCDEHDHILGPKRVEVEVEPYIRGQGDVDELSALVGKWVILTEWAWTGSS